MKIFDAHLHIIDTKAVLEIAATIEKLSAVSIDHLGLSKSGFSNLLALVDKGIRVKATRFGRIDFDATEAIQSIYSINPDALMFGTDLPSTMAERPFHLSDIEFAYNALEKEQAVKVFV